MSLVAYQSKPSQKLETVFNGHKMQVIGACETVRDHFVACAYAVGNVITNFFKSLRAILQDVNMFEQCASKSHRVFSLIGKVAETDCFVKLQGALCTVAGCFNLAQIANTIDYFINGRFKKDCKAVILGHIAFGVVTVSCALAWLAEMSVLSLSKAANTIGDLRIFSFVPKVVKNIPGLCDSVPFQKFAKSVGELRIFSCITKISIGVVISASVAIAYGFFAIEAFTRYFEAGANDVQKTSAALDATRYVFEVGYGVLGLCTTNVITLGVAAGVVLTMGITAFVYKVLRENELEAAVIQQGKLNNELNAVVSQQKKLNVLAQ